MTSLHADEAFLGHFQLNHDPFAPRVPGFKFFPAQRKPVLGQLHHLARYSQLLLVVTGPLGSGKTLLAMAAALQQQGDAVPLVLPQGSAEEAALVPGVRVYRAAHLLDVVRHFLPAGQDTPPGRNTLEALQPSACLPDPVYPDMADVKGQAAVRRALEICAAGGHSLLMVGPPGSGKSMLAQRLAGILPPLDEEELISVWALRSLLPQHQQELQRSRPFRSPHHSASAAAMVGGGSDPRPGEISLAHHEIGRAHV